jgi:hypothetical protein
MTAFQSGRIAAARSASTAISNRRRKRGAVVPIAGAVRGLNSG